jgi:hypothetical protein
LPGEGSRGLSKREQADGGRVARKAAKKAAIDREQRECYKAVDARDKGRCRVCGKRGSPTAASLLDRIHRHHMMYRSLGGTHATANVLSLCAGCHSEIHVEYTLRVEGDANARAAESGRLCGVKVERYGEAGWRVVGFV